ncbi:hypothetical protein FRC18_000523 [Serendipita sp. 400]|nr:hypothetical protein FRC18_000523 [Serendipita sp. 400]
MAYQKIVVVGPGGRLGAPLVQALLQSQGNHFEVTALVRSTSNYTVPPSLDSNRIRVLKEDFTDHSALVAALSGHDAVVLAIPFGLDLLSASQAVINAAIEAGIKRVIPSEFESDESPLTQPLYGNKQAVRELVKEAANEGKITYTLIRNGIWFDVGFQIALGFDAANKSVTLYDEGDRKFHTTTVPSVCRAIVSILANPTNFVNTVVHIHDFFVTQQDILAVVERVTESKFTVTNVDMEVLGKTSLEALMRGEFTFPNLAGVIKASIWGKESAARNIVVVGAGGKLGAPLFQTLLQSNEPKFTVTALIRSSSSYTLPEGVDQNRAKLAKVDFDDQPGLVNVLRGQDAIVFAFGAGPDLIPTSKTLIDAAIEAGVKRVIPSEFGNDEIPLTEPLFGNKQVVQKILQEAASQGKITYTLIRNGPWFDLGFTLALGFDIQARTATLYDNGDRKFHTTTVPSICRAITSLLADSSQSVNKVVHIHDFFITQLDVLKVTEEIMGSKFAITKVDTNEMAKSAMEGLSRGEFIPQNIFGAIRASVWGEKSAARWDENDDSAALGLGDADLAKEISKIAVLSK